MEPLPDESSLTADIEAIWQGLAAGRRDSEREQAEVVERGADLEAIGETLRDFSERRSQLLDEHRRQREERLSR